MIIFSIVGLVLMVKETLVIVIFHQPSDCIITAAASTSTQTKMTTF